MGCQEMYYAVPCVNYKSRETLLVQLIIFLNTLGPMKYISLRSDWGEGEIMGCFAFQRLFPAWFMCMVSLFS